MLVLSCKWLQFVRFYIFRKKMFLMNENLFGHIMKVGEAFEEGISTKLGNMSLSIVHFCKCCDQ